MKQLIAKSLRALLIVPFVALSVSAVLPGASALAECSTDDITIVSGSDCARGTGQGATLFGDGGLFMTITNVLLFIIGAISVIMLIIGGIRYTISGGDQNAVTAAKNTILYAIIGIIVAILAYAIVNFIVGSFVEA